jgi:hypothetical protein
LPAHRHVRQLLCGLGISWRDTRFHHVADTRGSGELMPSFALKSALDEFGVPGASQESGHCKHQSSSHIAGGAALPD